MEGKIRLDDVKGYKSRLGSYPDGIEVSEESVDALVRLANAANAVLLRCELHNVTDEPCIPEFLEALSTFDFVEKQHG